MERIDHYQIVEKIGEGGMGEVYKGIDVMLEREVAIKLLRPELSRREDIVERFRTEAIALGRLNHSHIATVYNFGRVDDQYYIAMEFVAGEPLDRILLKRGTLPWREAVDYAIQALEGLTHAHRSNVIHRDIKPANIIISGQNALKLLDFGIARILQTARLTRTQHTIGTPEYMSPEQHLGAEADARSDIYAIGMVLYEMLVGKLPFQAQTEYTLIKAIIENKPAGLRAIDDTIPADLEKLVLKALEKKPEKRFADTAAFIASLKDSLAKANTQPKPTRQASAPSSKKTPQWRLTSPWFLALGLSAICGSGYGLWQLKSPPPSLPNPPTNTAADLTATIKASPALQALLDQSVESLTSPVSKEALDQLETAANNGNVKAQAYLAAMYELGKGVAKDVNKALAWYQKAAEQGDANAQAAVADLYNATDTGGNIAAAFTWYQKASEQGHAKAQQNLAAMYQKGRGVAVDQNQAFYWYKKAADQGDAWAQHHVAFSYLQGLGTEKDTGKAIEFYQKAAAQGHAPSQAALAGFLAAGDGIPKDWPKAFELAQSAALQGDAGGEWLLGTFYKLGVGVTKDLNKAVVWLQDAASRGSTDAEKMLVEIQEERMAQNTNKPKPVAHARNEMPATSKNQPAKAEKSKPAPIPLAADLTPPAEMFNGYIPRNR